MTIVDAASYIWLAGFGYSIGEELRDRRSPNWIYDLLYVLLSALWPIAAAIHIVNYCAAKMAELEKSK